MEEEERDLNKFLSPLFLKTQFKIMTARKARKEENGNYMLAEEGAKRKVVCDTSAYEEGSYYKPSLISNPEKEEEKKGGLNYAFV